MLRCCSPGRHELFRRNAGLLKNSRQRAELDRAVVRHNATNRTATHDDVAAALPNDRESQALKGANSLSTVASHLERGDQWLTRGLQRKLLQVELGRLAQVDDSLGNAVTLRCSASFGVERDEAAVLC